MLEGGAQQEKKVMGDKRQGGEESVSTKADTKDAAMCEECKKNPSKYKCPGCSIRSCSLPCVKGHKQRTGCNGKRNLTQIIPLSQFNDNLLLSDYNMLEDVKRVAESAQRTRSKWCNYFKFPPYLRSLRGVASSRRTKILLLPSGMSRREKNQTRYDQKKKVISWTIEWRFHSKDVVLLDHGVCENASLGSVIENHLKPGPWNHQLKQFCDVQLDDLKFFICKYPKGTKSAFRQLDINAPIRQQFANLVILEYPVIHVFLPSHRYDFEVVKDCYPPSEKTELEESKKNNDHTPEGVTFREEEIEEENNDSIEPQVLDLMKQTSSSQANQLLDGSKSQKPVNESSSESDKPTREVVVVSTDDVSNSGTNPNELVGVSENMEFDFDQGLIDAYSDLIAEINPDSYLDFEGEFNKLLEFDPMEGLSDSREDEEGEEGEIP